MRYARFAIGPLILGIGLLLGFGAGCSDTESGIDGYVALVPRILRTGEREAVSLTLFSGDRLASGPAEVRLLQDGREVLTESAELQGKGTIEFEVPSLPDGDYEIEVRGEGFSDKASVRVEEGSLLFLETDKPIYKPGQTLHVRLISLDSELKPTQVETTVDLQDAKGTKVFKKTVQTDEYGIATLDVPISEEPNLGVWKVSAQAGEHSAEVDVRVEEYVLPKYEVAVDLPKEWFLVNEAITGKVRATYSYGKPVRGTLHIEAQRYVGQWEKFASYSTDIDGEAEFQLPAVEYVAGVPEERGMGNVTLEVTVEERATGYDEKTTRLLTVSESPVSVQLIPESSAFKPSLPFTFLVVTETPDNKPAESQVSVEVTYLGEKLEEIEHRSERVQTDNGLAMLTVTPPEEAVALMAEASTPEGAYTFVALDAAYSPSGNFIHIEQVSEGALKVGDKATFKVHSTREAANFYYEVVARGRVVFSDFSRSSEISFSTTPLMAPASRLLVYQILPNSEVAADYIPFDVEGDFPQSVSVAFSQEQVEPGDALDVLVQAQGPAKVGLVAVDRSVFILAENRLNLQQVFDELERLYMEPQAELHEATPFEGVTTRGAQETFEDAGLLVLSNKKVPEGKEYKSQFKMFGEADMALEGAPRAAAGGPVPAPTTDAASLAEVQRIRQYFPETWIWTDVMTDAQGRATLPVEAPDSITTWVLRAVALSQEQGLGVAESELTVLQPFFIQVDLPYSAVRGEEFPVKVALYNYLDQPQEFQVEMERSGWFETLGDPPVAGGSLTVGPNDIGSIAFTIRPSELGVQEIKVTARSPQAADAVVKNLTIVPEGVEREVVENAVLSAGSSTSLGAAVPPLAVEGSARAYLALTGSFLTQTIEGLDQLLQMPFGCGEQNMLLFAPDVFIARYLKETNQLKPEVMAKAEKLMITGYQRELTYRRSDGSFSAFGESDDEGSLWLTAFVLKTFAQAKDLMFIDEDVLNKAREWISQQQQADGSFEAVGFVHHEDMMGGVQGKTALTAYVAIALMEAGETSASAKAVDYLEGELAGIDDPYAMAIVAYALELAESPSRDQAHDQLMAMAEEDDDGLHWGGEGPIPLQEEPEPMPRMDLQAERSTAIEATGYATLALNAHGDRLNASRAARWLVTRRNAYGGFGSTQDTVVALQALTEHAAGAAADVDLTVTVEAGGERKQVTINGDNFDVLQVVDVPAGTQATVRAEGRGEVVVQHVTRFNLPQAKEQGGVFKIDVDYGTDQVEVNDTITVDTKVTFNPPLPLKAGMVVVDIAVPTGFEPVRESIEEAVAGEPQMKRFDVAGRKVIFYIEDMEPGDSISFSFQARALYPVRAKGVASQAYSYYNPEWRGETLGGEIAVSGGGE
jgi:CD109 antigen